MELDDKEIKSYEERIVIPNLDKKDINDKCGCCKTTFYVY